MLEKVRPAALAAALARRADEVDAASDALCAALLLSLFWGLWIKQLARRADEVDAASDTLCVALLISLF